MAGDAGFEPAKCGGQSAVPLPTWRIPMVGLPPKGARMAVFILPRGNRCPPRSAGSDPATGPGEGIRTPGPMLPKHVRYQTALHPDINGGECGILTRNATPCYRRNVDWSVLGTAALTILPTLRVLMAGAASAFMGKATPRRWKGNHPLPPTGQMVGLLGFEPRINRL